MCDAANKGADGAGNVVSTATVGEDFPTLTIFLGVKGEFDMGGRLEFVEGAG